MKKGRKKTNTEQVGEEEEIPNSSNSSVFNNSTGESKKSNDGEKKPVVEEKDIDNTSGNSSVSTNSTGDSNKNEDAKLKPTLVKMNPVRASPEDQQDITRYVPNRLRRLRRKIRSEAEHQEGGNRAKMMICQRCKEKIPFSSNTSSPNQDMFDHMYKCWLPSSDPPNKVLDEGGVKPNHSGNISMERDVDCLVFSIFSAGPYRGAYHLVLAVPVESATLAVLDHGLRVHWFNEGCYHGAMFYKKVENMSDKQTITEEFHPSQENKQESEAVIVDMSKGSNSSNNVAESGVSDSKSIESNIKVEIPESQASILDLIDINNLKEPKDKDIQVSDQDNAKVDICIDPTDQDKNACSNGWIEAGSLYWAKNPNGKFWASIVMPEPETGLTCRRYHEDETKSWPQLVGQVWHVVYIGRENRRAWVHLKDMEVYIRGKEDVNITYNTNGDRNPGFEIEDEDKKDWLAAIDLADEVKELGCNERINWLKEHGLLLDGVLDASESYTDYIIQRYGLKEKERIFAMWEELKEKHAWEHVKSYEQQLKDERDEKNPTSVIKHMEGWEIWPLIGREDEITDRVEPDRTDTDLTGIFTKPGEWAMYQYGLDDGMTTKCKIVYKGCKMLRLKGFLKSTSCCTLLKRDPEYEEDVRLEREQMDEEEINLSPSEDPDLVIKYIEPNLDKVTLLMQNEPPYTPCIVCKTNTAQFLDNGNIPFDREAKQSHFEKLYLFCSVSCARKWGKDNDRNLPVGLCYFVDNSPRTGICCHQNDEMADISLHILPESTLQIMKYKARKAWKVGRRIPYEDAERANGRPHPLWDEDRKFLFR